MGVSSQESIIDVIQRMVQEGQPREKIISTLYSLGVSDDQSKRLLLIAEADTFTLLKKEINGLVKQEMVLQKKDFEDLIKQEIRSIEEQQRMRVSEIAASQLKDVRTGIIEESKGFEGRINAVINDSQKTVSLVKVALDSIGARIAQLELDVEQMKVHKFRRKSMFFSYLMLGIGGVILAIAIGLLVLKFDALDIAQIVVVSVLILASVTMMFASIVG